MNGTLTRNAASQQQQQHHTRNLHHTLNGSNNYDPIELRRIQYQTPAMIAHPPIPIDDLFQHIERLKSLNNAKFAAEYESIEPGQQCTWEHSILDINRQKNRYANVIAYDHSRVILSKLPAHVFAAAASSMSSPNSTGNYQQQQQLSFSNNNGHYGLIGEFQGKRSFVFFGFILT